MGLGRREADAQQGYVTRSGPHGRVSCAEAGPAGGGGQETRGPKSPPDAHVWLLEIVVQPPSWSHRFFQFNAAWFWLTTFPMENLFLLVAFNSYFPFILPAKSQFCGFKIYPVRSNHLSEEPAI